MGTVVILNGEIVSPDKAHVSIFDRGLLFGDSVYDVIRTRNGRPFLLGDHIARLRRSAREIQLDLPCTDDDLWDGVRRALAEAGNAESYVRIIVTRGVGELDLFPGVCGQPTLILIARPLIVPSPETYDLGIRLALVERRRNSPQSLDPNAKTGNYLNNVLAMMEARDRGADDAVMLNADGYLTEGTASNLFFVREGVVHTPALRAGILDGITRGLVIGMLADHGLDCQEGLYLPEALLAAGEVFVTSTVRDALPVRAINHKTVGDGRAGPVAKMLYSRFAAL